MKFQKTIDITGISANQVQNLKLKRGQWVRRGRKRGRFVGVKTYFGISALSTVKIALYKPMQTFAFFQAPLEV